MPRARRQLVSLDQTPYYHCVSRCVRRAFLCGQDKQSGRNLEHRRQWIVDRLELLCSVFCIEVCAYAVMSNHYHLVLCCRSDRAAAMSDEELIHRIAKIWDIPGIVRCLVQGRGTQSQKNMARRWLNDRRERLTSLSWFMACLNEWVARKANAEDGCTGRFWEGRFRSQALLDEQALFTCMAYVDLNPVRADLCDSLEESDFTSIQARLAGRSQVPLKALGNAKDDLPMETKDYLALVEWTGRAAVPGKSGQITGPVNRVLSRLYHDPTTWRLGMRLFGTKRYAVIGSVERIREFAQAVGRNWLHGMEENKAVFKNG